MTIDEQDAILGRTTRELAEAKRALASLTTKAHDVGVLLVQLGKELQHSPAFVYFERMSPDTRFSSERRPSGIRPSDEAFRADAVDGNKFVDLITEIQEAQIKVWDLTERLARLHG